MLFSPWPRSSEVCKRGVNSLKIVDFSIACPLNSMSCLRGPATLLEIVFVGQCEVFVCLCMCCFSFGRKAHRSANGVSIL